MKSSLRTTIAAALVMLAPAATMLAVPATAHAVGPASHTFGAPGGHRVLIERFELTGSGMPGTVVHYRVYGVPRGIAQVQIPGHGGLELQETSPGIYEGHRTVRGSEDPRAFLAATATMQAVGTTVTARLGGGATAPVGSREAEREVRRDEGRLWGDSRWADPRSRDRRAPVIHELTPSNGDRINDRNRTRVSARYADDNSGVEPRDVNLRIDGRDVTGSSRVDAQEIQFRGDLAPGRHVAEVIVRDRAGNVARRSWNFDVVDRQGRGNSYDNSYGYGYGQRW